MTTRNLSKPLCCKSSDSQPVFIDDVLIKRARDYQQLLHTIHFLEAFVPIRISIRSTSSRLKHKELYRISDGIN